MCFWEKSIYKGEGIYKVREFRIRAFKIVLLKKKKYKEEKKHYLLSIRKHLLSTTTGLSITKPPYLQQHFSQNMLATPRLQTYVLHIYIYTNIQ